ncbi:hypothetical protein KAFR_0A04680 [Kazachstania africana CBS 2517]|uniref:Uncharacterized protein n=1 Tax=Kazachstania africana (strain ATCC 22294 / BCRC 22015 / CBS 2517 / CECT 1963 / NBRC 1671 / NRRL Y-8276) TaxID=1071382 RepID=H2ANF3_KAZAF|nr:hypothetical protein KAFR_0A04680 [Kazachstania africana CBS 2517]CCF55903.1 hypothetical protein KAFR_0A04680 [Kazachstania africana CBS 2517]
MTDGIEGICINLERAFQEQKEDILSLLTIIDIYGSNVNNSKDKDSLAKYLDVLSRLLEDSKEITNELGWELPKILLFYIDDIQAESREAMCQERVVISIMKCFDQILRWGNPKECILSSCELLADLHLHHDEEDDESLYKDDNSDPKNLNSTIAVFEIKAQLLLSLLVRCFERLTVLYPTKFLVMMINAVTTFVKKNIEETENAISFQHLICDFCIEFKPVTPSSSDGRLSKEEFIKIKEDERELQIKLLRTSITYFVSSCFKVKSIDFDLFYFNLVLGGDQHDDLEEEFINLCAKYYDLQHSYGIDLEKEFTQCLQNTRSMYNEMEKLFQPAAIGPNETDDLQAIYELSYRHSLAAELLHKELSLDPYGIIILTGISLIATKQNLCSDVSLTDSIYLFLRTSSASLYSENYHNKAVESVARYWIWVALTENTTFPLKKQLQELHAIVINAFLQMLLLKNATQSSNKVLKITFKQIARVLTLIPEDTSFGFILDTLLSCPYTHLKVDMINVLRHLMTASEPPNSNSLAPKAGSPPSLPPRLPPRPYIVINDDRMAAVHSLAMITLLAAKDTRRSQNHAHIILLLNYMNFFVNLRYKWDTGLLQTFSDEVSQTFSGANEEEMPEVGFIRIANETLRSFLQL